ERVAARPRGGQADDRSCHSACCRARTEQIEHSRVQAVTVIRSSLSSCWEKTMSRLALGLVLASSLVGGAAFAESQAEIADRLNEEGMQLLFASNYAEVSAKFQDANSRVPEPYYFYNHCL